MGIDIRAAALFVAITAYFSIASAQSQEILSQPVIDSPIGERNSKAHAGTEQFEFVIGDWDVDITFYPQQGEPLEYKAKWHNIWVVNGTVVFQEWRGPYATGAEVRHYNKDTNSWASNNVYTGNDWYETVSTWNEDTGEMTVLREMDGPQGEHLNEEIYHDITSESFKIRARKSFDEGTNWVRGSYKLTATRVH